MPKCYLKNCRDTRSNERRNKHEKGDKESNIYHSDINNDISNRNAIDTWIADKSICNRHDNSSGSRKNTSNG